MGKIGALTLLKLFINGNERCHTKYMIGNVFSYVNNMQSMVQGNQLSSWVHVHLYKIGKYKIGYSCLSARYTRSEINILNTCGMPFKQEH